LAAGLLDESLELTADRVHVHGHADALERGEADLERPLHEDRVIVHRLGGQPRRQRRVREHQVLDVDPIGLDVHARLSRLREGDDSGFHGPNTGSAP